MSGRHIIQGLSWFITLLLIFWVGSCAYEWYESTVDFFTSEEDKLLERVMEIEEEIERVGDKSTMYWGFLSESRNNRITRLENEREEAKARLEEMAQEKIERDRKAEIYRKKMDMEWKEQKRRCRAMGYTGLNQCLKGEEERQRRINDAIRLYID